MLAIPAALAPMGAAAASCFPSSCPPNDPQYSGGPTWNDEQWYLYSSIPPSAPASTDPENASGMSVDKAWQTYGAGRNDVVVAYMEGGVNWRINESRELRLRAYLNRSELPYPENAQGLTKPQLQAQGQHFLDPDPYDLNDDGVFNVDDYASDPRIPHPFLHESTAGGITPEDLIATFGHCQVHSGGVVAWPCDPTRHYDNDGNGYANDISGWNFHRDTNDPQTDQSIYAHSDGESAQAVGEANNSYAGAGMCPFCRLLEVKAGDEAIDRPDRVAEAITFAVDSHAKVIVGVIASLGLTPEVKAALQYAYDHGVVVAWASNDFESADHTDGMFYSHLWPGNSITGNQSTRGQQSPAVVTNTTFRSRSTLTSYGPHALFSVPNNDGSTSTGTPTQGGVAALVISEGLNAVDQGLISAPLTADEVKQVVRSTVSVIDDPTLPFPGEPGATFNVNYGYGRPNVDRAMQAVHDNLIPPSVDIQSPDWYQAVDPTQQSTLKVVANLSALRADGRQFSYDLQYGLGPQPTESQFVTFAHGTGAGAKTVSGTLDLTKIPSSFWAGQYALNADRSSIEQYDVTIRVQVHAANHGTALMGEDRRAFHLRHDDTELPGFPKLIGSSGESSPSMADIEGRGWLDTIVATADGTVHAFRPNGSEAPGFPVHTGPAPGVDPASDVNYLNAPAWKSGAVPRPRDGISSATAVGDLFHTGQLDVVASTLSGRTYVWDGAGKLLHGFPVQTSRAYAHQSVPPPDTPYVRNASTGTLAAPVLVDLEGKGQLDIVQAAWDGHIYAWRPDGTAVPGWPASTDWSHPGTSGTHVYARDFKVVSTPAVAYLNGESKPSIVVGLQDTSWDNGPNQGIPVSGYLTAYSAGGVMRSGFPVSIQAVQQGYGTAQDFVTEGVIPPVVIDLPTGPVAVANPNLFLPYVIDLDHAQVIKQFAPAVIPNLPSPATLPNASAPSLAPLAALPAGAMVQFTTAPAAGNVSGVPGSVPQVFQAGSNAADVVAGVLELPGEGVRVHNGIGGWDPVSGATLPQFDNLIQGLGFFTSPAVADVTGDGRPDVIQSADSGALMAFDGATGQTAAGFPKWTGGWGLYTPAVGDLTGGGTVDVAQMTREGYLHVYTTPGLASANDQAWHWHQDDRNTGHYGTDTRPPAAVRDLGVRLGTVTDTLSFTAPGDDWNSGTAARYEVRRASQPITQATWASATAVPVTVTPQAAGAHESLTVPHAGGQNYYAVRAIDAAGNIGPVRLLSEGSDLSGSSQGNASVAGLATLPNTATPAAVPVTALALVALVAVPALRRRRAA